MMTSESKTANAIGGKTARACDSCLSKRARWFCPADDAFLCQSCDVSVHSVNQLASRHERVRLETSSNKSTDTNQTHQPAWHQGFTRKARTPRNGKKTQIGQRKKDEENRVPEIGSDENEFENEEQLLYQVPVFDPFEAELCTVPDETATITDLDILLNTEDASDDLGLPEFLSSDIELAEFAADVETLIGEKFRSVEEEEEEESSRLLNDKSIKIEVEDEEMRAVVACHLHPELDIAREALNWNFDEYYEETVEQKVIAAVAAAATTEFVASADYSKADVKKRLLLRLNHEAVISAWPNQSSPWTNGIRPHFNPDDCWPDFLETCGGGHQGYYGGHVRSGDGGREARVSRYREKRRTRLFSKKIRYQVRKLNAEKRPRLKGRFIKRTSFSGPGFPYLMNKR